MNSPQPFPIFNLKEFLSPFRIYHKLMKRFDHHFRSVCGLQMGQDTQTLVGPAVKGLVTKKIQRDIAWNTVIQSTYFVFILG